MYTNVSQDVQCTPTYINVHQYTPVYINVHHCTPVYINIHQYTPLYTSVHQCTPMYISVLQCTSMYTNDKARSCTKQKNLIKNLLFMYTNAHQCTSMYTNVPQCTPMYTNVPQCTPMFPNVHQTEVDNKCNSSRIFFLWISAYFFLLYVFYSIHQKTSIPMKDRYWPGLTWTWSWLIGKW